MRNLKKRYQKFSQIRSHEGVFWNKKHNVVSGNQEVLKKIPTGTLTKKFSKFILKINYILFFISKHNKYRYFSCVSYNKQKYVSFSKSYGRTGFYVGEEHFDLMRHIFESGVNLRESLSGPLLFSQGRRP